MLPEFYHLYFIASQEGNSNDVISLLNSGANVNAQDSFGNTPILIGIINFFSQNFIFMKLDLMFYLFRNSQSKRLYRISQNFNI